MPDKFGMEVEELSEARRALDSLGHGDVACYWVADKVEARYIKGDKIWGFHKECPPNRSFSDVYLLASACGFVVFKALRKKGLSQPEANAVSACFASIMESYYE